jgi:deoxyribose-phosphate aldolase
METIESISLAGFIESTNLKPDATLQDIQLLCSEAAELEFYGICVSPYFVQSARKALKKSTVKLITVVGFPLGYSTTSAKVEETKKAIISGADEIDMVINISALKSGDFATVQNDIQAVVTACHLQNKVCKVIIETALLNEEEIGHVCRMCIDADADFVKTSTGFASQGATVEGVQLLRKLLPPKVRIKAAGGIKTPEFAQQLIHAGAVRLGTSSGKFLIQMHE